MNLGLPSEARQNVLIALLICSILPFLINGLFSHPWTDDYYYSALARDAGFVKAFRHHYSHFNGRYFSISLVLANPLVYGQLWGYKLIPWALALALFAAVLVLVSSITRGVVALRARLVLTLAVVLVYFDQMPDIRSGLYWMSGSLTYQAGAILLLLFCAALLWLSDPPDRQQSILPAAAAVVLAGCLPGTNEVILFLLFPLLALGFCVDHTRGGRASRRLLVVLAVLGVGASLALLAPGNSSRLATYAGNRNLLVALQQSAEAACTSMMTWATTPSVLVLTLGVVTSTRRDSRLRKVMRGMHPGFAMALLGLLVFACFFPPFWSTGHYPERRVLNIVYLFFLTGWLINAAIIAAHPRFEKLSFPLPLSRTVAYPALTLFLVSLLFLGHSNWLLVTTDLCSGTSSRFDQELRERYARIRLDPQPHHAVSPLQNTPRSLFFADINLTGDSWINQSYADYYGKQSLVLKNSP